MRRFIPYFTLLIVVLTSTALAWAPNILRQDNKSMLDVYKQFDGPLYIIPAKTGYNPTLITLLNRDGVLPQTPMYFAAHLPLYPFCIALFAPIMGYLRSMIFVNVLFTILLVWFFYFMLRKMRVTSHPIVLSIIFLSLPRFLVVRTVGAPESLFILCVLSSLYFFERKSYALAGVLGGLSVATKAPGILLFLAYVLACVESYSKTKKIERGWVWIVMIPLSLIIVFAIYWMQFGDFFAFFHTGGSVPMPYPFASLNANAKWVGTAWLEDILFYFLMYGLTIYQLKNIKERSFFYFGLVYLAALIFVEHRDIARYGIPLWPLTCIAFSHLLTTKKFVVVSIILLMGIYLYTWGFLARNIMPITEWLPFM